MSQKESELKQLAHTKENLRSEADEHKDDEWKR